MSGSEAPLAAAETHETHETFAIQLSLTHVSRDGRIHTVAGPALQFPVDISLDELAATARDQLNDGEEEERQDPRAASDGFVFQLLPSRQRLTSQVHWQQVVRRWQRQCLHRQLSVLLKAVRALEPLLHSSDDNEQLRALVCLREIVCNPWNIARGVAGEKSLRRVLQLSDVATSPAHSDTASGDGAPAAADKSASVDVVLQACACMWTLMVHNAAAGAPALDPASGAKTYGAVRRRLRALGALPVLMRTLALYTPEWDALDRAKNDRSGWTDTLSLLGGRLKRMRGNRTAGRKAADVPLSRKLQLEVISASRLATLTGGARKRGALRKGSVHLCDPYCIVKWDDNKVGQTSMVESTSEPEWENEMFAIQLPIKEVDMFAHKLRVEVYDMNRGEMGHFLGCVEVRGQDLMRLPGWAQDCNEISRRNYALEPKPGTDEDAIENRFVQGKLQLGFNIIAEEVDAGPPKNLEVEVLSAAGLANADEGKGKAAMSDPFAIVFWNDQKVHTTRHFVDNNDPVWRNERCTIKQVPADFAHCSLRVALYDYDGPGRRGEFLGQVQWDGAEEILSAATDMKLTCKLEKQKNDKRLVNASLRGTVANKYVKGTLSVRLNVVDMGLLAGVQLPKYQTLCGLSACIAVRFTVVGAAKLGTKKSGRPDPFCVVSWDGNVIGHTLTIDADPNPNWQESFILPLHPSCIMMPGTIAAAKDGGDETSGAADAELKINHEESERSHLQIEVFGRDKTEGAVHTSDFLGELVLDGTAVLEECMAGSKRSFKLAKKHSGGKQKLARGSITVEFDRLEWLNPAKPAGDLIVDGIYETLL
eukprot:g1602.t1